MSIETNPFSEIPHKLPPLPLGIQSFEKLRTKGYVYVDKTESVIRLLEFGSYFFLARPRRFGKSLLLSTMECVFSGKKHLFKNLYISKIPFNWEEWHVPTLVIDMTLCEYHRTRRDLEESLKRILREQGLRYGVDLNPNDHYLKEFFHETVKGVHENTGKNLAILIDEYDKPIVECMDDKEKARENRDALREFYGVLKPLDKYLQFAFLTGVSKFSRVSLFSGLNNLEDITLDPRFATICGITEEEMKKYLNQHLNALAKSTNEEVTHSIMKMKEWYDGYSWNGTDRVFNPHSLFLALKKQQFYPFWFDTGTPTFLMHFLKKEPRPMVDMLEPITVSMEILDAFDIETIDPHALLFQTGYLTIKSMNIQNRTLVLGFPNLEVKESFLSHLFASWVHVAPSRARPHYLELLSLLERRKHAEFCQRLQSLVAGIPHVLHVPREAYYHSLFYLLFSLLGCHVEAEVLTDRGRLDVVLFLKDVIYIIEFKHGRPNAKDLANKAIIQIKERQYYLKYLRRKPARIILMGIAIDHERNLDCVTEELPQEDLLSN